MASSISEETAVVSPADEPVECRTSRDVAKATSAAECASGRSPLATLMGVQILGTGAYLPEAIVRNEDLVAVGLRSRVDHAAHGDP